MKSVTLVTAAAAAGLLAAPALADGGLTFIIDGDTFNAPFHITNTSTAGEFVVGFGLDLTGTGIAFDTVEGGPPATNIDSGATPFMPTDSSDALTGLNGPVTVADGASSFAITFSHFAAGQTFSWLLDVDPVTNDPGANVTVLGNQLIGAHAYVDFSNGLRALGVLGAVDGNPDASAFTVTSVVPTPGVPEPASWAMMLGGFGLIGGALRNRRRSSVSFG